MDDTVNIRDIKIDTDLTIGLGDMAVHIWRHGFFRDDEVAVLSVIWIYITDSFTNRLENNFSIFIRRNILFEISLIVLICLIRLTDRESVLILTRVDVLDLFILDLCCRRAFSYESFTHSKVHDALIFGVRVLGSSMINVVELTALNNSGTCSSDPAGTGSRYRSDRVRIRKNKKTGCRVVADSLCIRNVPDDLSGDVLVDILILLGIVTGVIGIGIHRFPIGDNDVFCELDAVGIQNVENNDRARIFLDLEVFGLFDTSFKFASGEHVDIDSCALVALVCQVDDAFSGRKISDLVTIYSRVREHLIRFIGDMVDHTLYSIFQVSLTEGTVESFALEASFIVCEKARIFKSRCRVDHELHSGRSVVAVFRTVGIAESGLAAGDRGDNELGRLISCKVDVAVIVLLVEKVRRRVGRLHVVSLLEMCGNDTIVDGTS